MAAFQKRSAGGLPEELTARDPFAYRAVWQPTIDDQVADIGDTISGRSVVVRDVPIVGLPDREGRLLNPTGASSQN